MRNIGSGELGAHGEERREQSHSNLGEKYCKWGLSVCKALELDRIWCAVCARGRSMEEACGWSRGRREAGFSGLGLQQ